MVLQSLRERLARQSIHLLLDFVPNHTSKDHHYVDERPDVFIQRANRGTASKRSAC